VISSWRLELEGMTSKYLRDWRECNVLPHVKLEAMLTTYIKATIWRVISFSSFESTTLHPSPLRSNHGECASHGGRGELSSTILAFPLCHGCTRGNPMSVHPQTVRHSSPRVFTRGRDSDPVGAPQVFTRGRDSDPVGAPRVFTRGRDSDSVGGPPRVFTRGSRSYVC
jgi:hypothetical protein